MNVDTDMIECQDFPVFLDQTKENLGQYILNPLLYIEGAIARDVRGIRNDLDLHQALK